MSPLPKRKKKLVVIHYAEQTLTNGTQSLQPFIYKKQQRNLKGLKNRTPAVSRLAVLP